MSPAVVFLPDTALLVPGAAGRADPAAELRAAALVALRSAAPGPGGRVLVVAPGRCDRVLTHPVGSGLGAAGLVEPDPVVAGSADVPPESKAPRERARAASGPAHHRNPGADVPASTALALLRLAGSDAPVDVVEIARTPATGGAPRRSATGGTPRTVGEPTGGERVLPVDEVAEEAVAGDPAGAGVVATTVPLLALDDVATVVVVGSLSARHGPDAPLADDDRAPDVDARLLAALSAGPSALARALDDLGAAAAHALAVSGHDPWRAVLAALPDGAGEDGVDRPRTDRLHAVACTDAVVAGAQHAVALWLPADPPRTAPDGPSRRPASTSQPRTGQPVVPSPEESR